jgi:hypothetical protein
MHFKIDPSLWPKDGEPILSNYDDDAFQEHARQTEAIAKVENFGLWTLSIEDAAFIIAADMLDSEEIECPALEDFEGSISDAELRAALSETVSLFEERLINAIEIGRLIPQHLTRTFDEEIVRSETFIRHDHLEAWVNERGYYFGESFTEWYDAETELAGRVVDELIWLRNVKRVGKSLALTVGFTSNPELMKEWDRGELIDAYKALMLENEHLREKLARSEAQALSNKEASASPKSRKTLLLVIASLMDLLKAPTTHPRPRGMNQSAIKEAILEKSNLRGLGDRNLQEIFASANKAKADAE